MSMWLIPNLGKTGTRGTLLGLSTFLTSDMLPSAEPTRGGWDEIARPATRADLSAHR